MFLSSSSTNEHQVQTSGGAAPSLKPGLSGLRSVYEYDYSFSPQPLKRMVRIILIRRPSDPSALSLERGAKHNVPVTRTMP